MIAPLVEMAQVPPGVAPRRRPPPQSRDVEKPFARQRVSELGAAAERLAVHHLVYGPPMGCGIRPRAVMPVDRHQGASETQVRSHHGASSPAQARGKVPDE